MDKREEMYAVILRGGGYSDSWTSVIAVSDDLEKCNEYIKQCKKEDADHDATVRRLIREFEGQYLQKFPQPELDRSQLLERTRWKAGLKKEEITPEMRAERERVEEHNRTVFEAHGKVVDAWREVFDKEQANFLLAIGVPADQHEHFIGYHGYDVRTEDRRYSVEKVMRL